ncbi:MAG TPA: glycosyltransferase family 4 protein [Acidimicrobiales bacterium]|nr:glycosyltransferase family 4 protein [Acidimicrobiales bacterium]
MSRPLRVLTWHVHGNYLWYLSHIPHELVLPVRPGRPHGYGGRSGAFPWPDTVREVPVEHLAEVEVDAVLYQAHHHWLVDRHELLSPAQRAVPQIVLEHDPPRASPTDTRHPVDDPDALVVHVTAFNDLMWDCGRTPTAVIEHGVAVPGDVAYAGTRPRGITVVNDLARRGRRLGLDVFLRARRQVPLDLVGMGSEELGGLGEVPPPDLARAMAPYRFYFHPVRYTSLGLSLCEAMTVGLPVVALATTEVPTIVEDGLNGFASTDEGHLVEAMRALVADPGLARRVGDAGRATAAARFSIDRFVRDWDRLLRRACGRTGLVRPGGAPPDAAPPDAAPPAGGPPAGRPPGGRPRAGGPEEAVLAPPPPG